MPSAAVGGGSAGLGSAPQPSAGLEAGASNAALRAELALLHNDMMRGRQWAFRVDNFVASPEFVDRSLLCRQHRPTHPLALFLQQVRGGVPLRDLARGPGRLAAALSIDLAFDGVDLCGDGPLHLAEDGNSDGEVAVSRRIGITKAADRLLRFYLRGSRFVSGPARP